MLFSLVQACFRGVNLSAHSISHWSMFTWASFSALGILLAFLLYSHVRYMMDKVEYCKTSLVCCLIFAIMYVVASPSSLHVHHWFSSLLLCLFLGSSEKAQSRMTQAVAFGIFTHGGACFGFAGIFSNMPDCNK